MFERQPAYLKVVQDNGFRLPADYLDFAPTVRRRSSAVLEATDQTTVPCNNDLLAGNFVDDGERVWLIDYEYSGNNDPCFELGNIWAECGLSTDQLDELVTAVLRAPAAPQDRAGPPAGHRRQVRLDAVGMHPEWLQRNRFRLLGLGDGTLRRRRRRVPRPGLRPPARRRAGHRLRPRGDDHVRRTSLPDRAQIVIIGGGVIGTSVAYHLTKLGRTDVVLLEQGQLSCGTTWHAAGLVGQLRASESGTRLVQYSTALYAELEAETGLTRRLQAVRRGDGGPHRGPDDAAAPHRGQRGGLQPGLRTAQSRAGFRALPGDADRRPGRRHLAARRRQGQSDRPDDGAGQGRTACAGPGSSSTSECSTCSPTAAAVTGVRTDAGDIEAEIVVNCAGQWAKADRRDGRRQRAAVLGRALLRRHRDHRRRAPGPADPARPRRLHLLQGRGRRPGDRRVRAGGQAVGGAGQDSRTRSNSNCWKRIGSTSRS